MEPNDPESDGEAAGSGSFTQSKMQRERKIKEKEKKREEAGQAENAMPGWFLWKIPHNSAGASGCC